MRELKKALFLLSVIMLVLVSNTKAQNPLVRDQFSADPTARVFEGKVYVYPSHDIPARPGKGRAGWFVMEDYHVFSSENLTDWKDHGMIVSQYKVDWVDSTMFNMWAPDCMEKNGKYYFYFPAGKKDKTSRGGGIGVAIADKPYGPFKPEPTPMVGLGGIDPNIFVDDDGQAYIIVAGGGFQMVKLKDNMLEIADKPVRLEGLPDKGLKEGPFMFKRNGIYYLTYPHVQNKTEQLEYAISDKPMGPFKVTGVIMDERPECWTNHHSIIEYKKQWYLFYHYNDLSPNFDKNRSIRADSLFFNADGTIKKITQTFRGVGITKASDKIQIDRYSLKGAGASFNYINPDTTKRFDGWKAIFDGADAWMQYNSVDFGKGSYKTVNVKAVSKDGGVLEVRLGNQNGAVLAQVKIPAGTEWKNYKASVKGLKKGIQNLVVTLKDKKPVEVDWLKFE